MAGKTQTLEGNLLNHIFRATAYTAPTTVYVGLFTAAPSDTGGGTEVTGGSYARTGVTSSTGNWAAPSGTPRQISNANVITWGTNPTADWGTVVAIGLFSSLAGAASTDLLYWTATQADGSTAISKVIQNGDTVSIAANQLIIRED